MSSIVCLQIQAAVGLAVRLKWISSLCSWLMKKNTYRDSKPIVCTTIRSGRPDTFHPIPQERSPTLTYLALRTSPSIAAYRSIADHDGELEEFASDALGTPSTDCPATFGQSVPGPLPFSSAATYRTRDSRKGPIPLSTCGNRPSSLAIPAASRTDRLGQEFAL